MTSILVLNGPNLNLLGQREPEIYGTATLASIEDRCATEASRLGVKVGFHQSNHEGELVDAVQEASSVYQGLILNAAAFTHTSVALADAVKAIDIPAVEVHMSNIYGREPFRRHSFLAEAVVGSICGFGPAVYLLALQAMADLLKDGS